MIINSGNIFAVFQNLHNQASVVTNPGASSPSLFFVLNARSGKGDKAFIREKIEDVLNQVGRTYHIRVIENSQQIDRIAQETVAAAKACGGIVVAVGGDGTISAIANAVHGSGCAFGVLPQGTFNYFARTHGIPENLLDSIHTVLHARPHPVQVGLLNNRLFLVNASIGFYRQILEDREAYKEYYGRSRIVAYWSGLMTILRHCRSLRITWERSGSLCKLRTPTLFVGNNRLQLEHIGMPLTEILEDGQLTAIAVPPVNTFSLLWLGVRGALGKLGAADKLNSFGFKRLIIKSSSRYRARRVKVAIDGEIVWFNAPLEFQVASEPLHLLKPDSKSAFQE